MVLATRVQHERAHFNALYREGLIREPMCLDNGTISRYCECKDCGVYGKECAFTLSKPLVGRDVLEVGCGIGTDSILLANNGARVFAYDVSEQAIQIAKRRAKLNGVSDRIIFTVSSDMVSAFPGRQFDVVFSNAVFHHLDIGGLPEKIDKILKPGGKCVFREPVVLANWLGKLRKLIRWYPTNPTPYEKPLSKDDLNYIVSHFVNIEMYYFECFSRIWYLLRSNKLIDFLHRIDAKMFRKFPVTKVLASVVVVKMEKPQQ